MVVGWAVTTVVVAALWRRRLPARPMWPGIALGLTAGMLWPLTLWIAVGMWWYGRGRGLAGAAGSHPAGRTPAKAVVAACAIASILSFGAVGATAPAPGSAEPSVPAAVSEPTVAPETGTVTRIVDGDTVEVSTASVGLLTVRVLGIDSPEVGAAVQCGGPDAREFAARALLRRSVDLTTDPTQDRADRYGRALRYVSVAGSDYSVLATEAGFARAYVASTPVQAHQRILAAEERARAARLGIWGASVSCVEPPAPLQQQAPVRQQAPVQQQAFVPRQALIGQPAPVQQQAPVRQFAAAARPLVQQPAPAHRPAPRPQSTPKKSEPAAKRGGSASYKNCAAARAAGAAPVRRGDPGYAAHLDRDNDGVGCE